MPNLNVQARNAHLDSSLNTTYANGRFRAYSGSRPATANLAPTGTLLADITIPATPFAAASAGAAAKTGTWQDASADGGSATAVGYWRLSGTGDDGSLDGAFPRMDFTAAEVVADGNVTAGQQVTVTSLSIGQPAS